MSHSFKQPHLHGMNVMIILSKSTSGKSDLDFNNLKVLNDDGT